MADDLELLVSSIESEGASPEFVARLRERIIAETELSTETVDPVVEIELLPEAERGSTAKPWILVAAAAAVVLLVVGVVAMFVTDDDGGIELIDTAGNPTAVFTAEAAPLTVEDALVEPGTYRVDSVGTPFTFTIDQPQAVQVNSEASFVLTHPASQGSADRDLVITRLSALADPARPTVALEERGDGWPAGDFGGWLDNLTDEIVVSNRVTANLGGLDAMRVDLELGATGCVVGAGACLALGTNGLITRVELLQGSTYRVWVVDQGEEDPLVVIAGISRESDTAWFDTVETILSTLAFGDVGLNPIVDAPAGEIELPFLGGVRFELREGSFVMRNPVSFDGVVLEGWPAQSQFLTNPLDVDGTVLQNPAELVATLQSSDAVAVTAVGSMVVDGVEAQLFDIAGRSPESLLWPDAEVGDGWQPPARGRMWLIDHPERGLLMVTAEASENVDVAFPLILAQTEAIIESMEFIGGG